MIKYKRIFLIFWLILFEVINLTAQVQKHDITVESLWNFRFSKKGDDSNSLGITSEETEEKRISNYKISNELSFSISKNFAVGLAFEYTKEVDEITRRSNSLGFNNPIGTSSESIDSKVYTAISPGIFLKRFTPLSKKFQVISKLGFYHLKERLIEDRFVSSPIGELRELFEMEKKYININFTNSMVYYLTPFFGIELRVIDLGIQTLYHDRRYPDDAQATETNFYTDINPLNWRYGIIVIFGKKRTDINSEKLLE